MREYIQNSNIEVGVLIGNELVGSATVIRRQIGISVFVKFAQGARSPGNPISQVEALDMYYLPTYNLKLELDSVKYNKATEQIEISLRNAVEQAIYFKGTYSVDAADGSSQRIGDVDPVFIEGGSIKTMVYDVSPLPEGENFVEVFIVYGESKNSLERVIDDRVKIETISVLDHCEISLNQLQYNEKANVFAVETENIGDVPCFVNAELIDIIIAGERKTVGTKEIALIDVGETAKLKIEADLSEEDLNENELVKVKAHYGERKNNLVKIKEAELPILLTALIFGLTPNDLMFYSLLLIIIIMIALIVYKRKKQANHFKF